MKTHFYIGVLLRLRALRDRHSETTRRAEISKNQAIRGRFVRSRCPRVYHRDARPAACSRLRASREPFGARRRASGAVLHALGARERRSTREKSPRGLWTARPAPRGGTRSRACAGSGARGRARARARARDARRNAYLGTQMARVGEPRLLQAVAAVRGVKSGPACPAKLRERGVAP